jgi:hypothetical protein
MNKLFLLIKIFIYFVSFTTFHFELARSQENVAILSKFENVPTYSISIIFEYLEMTDQMNAINAFITNQDFYKKHDLKKNDLLKFNFKNNYFKEAELLKIYFFEKYIKRNPIGHSKYKIRMNQLNSNYNDEDCENEYKKKLEGYLDGTNPALENINNFHGKMVSYYNDDKYWFPFCVFISSLIVKAIFTYMDYLKVLPFEIDRFQLVGSVSFLGIGFLENIIKGKIHEINTRVNVMNSLGDKRDRHLLHYWILHLMNQQN